VPLLLKCSPLPALATGKTNCTQFATPCLLFHSLPHSVSHIRPATHATIATLSPTRSHPWSPVPPSVQLVERCRRWRSTHAPAGSHRRVTSASSINRTFTSAINPILGLFIHCSLPAGARLA